VNDQRTIAESNFGGRVHTIDLNEQLQESVPYLSKDFSITAFTQKFEYERGDYIPLHWHPEFQIIWVYEGGLAYQINDKVIPCGKDSILILNQQQFHSSKPMNGNAEVLCFNFFLEFLHPKLVENYIKPIVQDSAFSFHQISLSPDRTNKLNRILNAVGHSINYLTLANFITAIFEEIIEEYDHSSPSYEYEDTQLFNTLLTYVQNNYANKITINDLANHALINRNRCLELFHKYSNSSPMKYINQYRLHIASGLLVTTDDTITQVAERAGFNHVSYFIEQFKQHYALTPLAYRKRFGLIDK
jgi:AraC-like DNA-binding protein